MNGKYRYFSITVPEVLILIDTSLYRYFQSLSCRSWISPESLQLNSEYYIQALKTTTMIKTCSISSLHFFLHNDNKWPHTSVATIKAIKQLGFRVILHPPYSLDSVPRITICSTIWKNIGRVSVTRWIESSCVVVFHLQLSEFYETGIKKLILCWLCCTELDDKYFEIKHSK